MKNTLTTFLIAALSILIVGCASTGNNFDEGKVAQIKKGETTELDLIQLFGQPQSRSMNSEGQSILTWSYTESRVKGETFIPYAGMFMGGANSAHKMLMVTLANGKVANFSSTTGATQTRENQVQAVPK